MSAGLRKYERMRCRLNGLKSNGKPKLAKYRSGGRRAGRTIFGRRPSSSSSSSSASETGNYALMSALLGMLTMGKLGRGRRG